MIKRLISFHKAHELAALTGNAPKPAIRAIPDWYKQLAAHAFPKGQKGYFDKMTIKACPPFLDSMTMGYVISLEVDLLVEQVNGIPSIQWNAGWQQVEKHVEGQIAKQQIPKDFSEFAFKFMNPYVVQTPAGYSSLFMHPLNRTDLPFFTLSGVVETDTYYSNVNFPFFLREGFEGLIPAGTPIVQVVPIKRETWGHRVMEADNKKLAATNLRLRGKILRSYKSQWWQRKNYN